MEQILNSRRKVWRATKFPLYEASSCGKIRNAQTKNLLRPYINHEGYKKIGLVTTAGRKKFFVHRLVAETFIHNHSEKPIVNHKNSRRRDNRVENLEWATHSENLVHSWLAGARAKKYGRVLPNK